MKHLFILLMLIMFNTISFGQTTRQRGIESMGIGVQFYPAGTIINLKSSWAVSAKELLTGKIGYNIARRKDFGKHDNEEGGGPGFTAAYKRYLKTGFAGWFVEARASIWFLDIDWRDNTPPRSGNTDISIFQPTIGLGYDWLVNEKFKLGLIAAFGYEINVITSGEPVGEGGISLAGFSFAYKLSSRRSAKAQRK